MINREWYAMFDQKLEGVPTPALRIDPNDALRWNMAGYGIFWAVNSFAGGRKIANLTKIHSWALDLDYGTKQEQWERITSGLYPSLIVETARGFQIYFDAQDAKPQHWNAIVLDRLLPFYGADPRARDMARILRVPGFYHLKNPQQPFLVEERWRYPVQYTEMQLANYYPLPTVELENQAALTQDKQYFGGQFNGVWDRIYALDCMYGLDKLSGTEYVNHEVFTFRRVGNGNYNIFVNGKSTSCWVDKSGRIGSFDKGGPTLTRWIEWYGRSKQEAFNIVKTMFPEVCQ